MFKGSNLASPRHKEEMDNIRVSVILQTSGLYYKPLTIVNGNARVVNKLEASLTDNAWVVIYDRHMFIVQATGRSAIKQIAE